VAGIALCTGGFAGGAGVADGSVGAAVAGVDAVLTVADVSAAEGAG